MSVPRNTTASLSIKFTIQPAFNEQTNPKTFLAQAIALRMLPRIQIDRLRRS